MNNATRGKNCSQGPRVLAIEDHEDLLDLMVRALRHLGCEVRGFPSPPLSGTDAPTEPFDLLVIGMDFADAAALHFLRNFRSAHPAALLAIIVSQSFSEGSPTAAEALAHIRLTRPVYPADLLRLVALYREHSAVAPVQRNRD